MSLTASALSSGAVLLSETPSDSPVFPASLIMSASERSFMPSEYPKTLSIITAASYGIIGLLGPKEPSEYPLTNPSIYAADISL